MKYNYKFKSKTFVLIGGIISFLLVSCSSYQDIANDDDGIYVNDNSVVEKKVSVKDNTKYYEDYFSEPVVDFGQVVEEEVFTDVESYSSQGVTSPNKAVTIESYSAWEDADDSVTINVYNSQPYYNTYYNPYWRPYNSFYYTGWGFCSPVWGGAYYNYGYYGNPYFNYGYYGNPYYNNYGYRNVGYANSNRGYASNNYYNRRGGSYYGRNESLRASNFRRNTSSNVATNYRGSSFRRTNTSSNVRSRSTPRTSPRSTPRTSPRSTPRTSPRSTPGTSPRSTPRTSPRSTPRTSPRSAPRTSPRSAPRSSSSRRGRG